MRILSIHNRYQLRGGEDESYEAELALLRDRGHTVDPYEQDNRRITQLGPLRSGLRSVWCTEAYRDIRQRLARHECDLVHVQNFFPLISPSCYYAARDAGVPAIQTLHNYRLLCPGALLFREGEVCERCIGRVVPWPGILHRCYRQSRSASVAVAAMVASHRLASTWASMVDAYIALTEFSRQKFIQGGLPAQRIVVKPHFVHPDPGVGEGRGGYALLVSRLSPEKGIGTVLKAWRRRRFPVPLKIIGDGPLADDVMQSTRDLPQVQWLGRRNMAEVYQLMREASCLLFPSLWYETFGRVVIEAFAVGTPVLGSRIGAIAELVREGQTGLLFEPGDPDDLARKLEQLLSSPGALSRMRDNARDEFLARYTADRHYQMIRAIYEAAAKRTLLSPSA